MRVTCTPCHPSLPASRHPSPSTATSISSPGTCRPRAERHFRRQPLPSPTISPPTPPQVEIGGDDQSTDGTEPSWAHDRSELGGDGCTRGYEAWLISEAQKRNPSIITYALAWGVPAWIGNGSYYTMENVNYHVGWAKCIERTTGNRINYMGVSVRHGRDIQIPPASACTQKGVSSQACTLGRAIRIQPASVAPHAEGLASQACTRTHFSPTLTPTPTTTLALERAATAWA